MSDSDVLATTDRPSPSRGPFGRRSGVPQIVQDALVDEETGEVRAHAWLEYASGQNLTSVLNDPRGSLWAPIDLEYWAERVWGDGSPVEPTAPRSLPKVHLTDFSTYMNGIRELLALFQQNHASDSIAATPLPDFFLSPSTDLTSSMSEDVANCYKLVPDIYFQADFCLEDRANFDAIHPPNAPPGNMILQEKLSHYLDVVEVNLLQQVCARSDQFFVALKTLQDLHNEVKRSCVQIENLRKHVSNAETIGITASLRVAQLLRRRANMVNLYRKLRLMSIVRQTQPTIQLLLSTNDFAGALDLIDSTLDVLRTELAGVYSFKHLGPQLVEIVGVIEKMMQREFISLALGTRKDEGGKEGMDGITSIEDIEVDQEQIAPIIFGLLRVNKIQHALQEYRAHLSTHIKMVVKQTVSETLVTLVTSSDIDDKEGGVVGQLRQLDHVAFSKLVHKIFQVILDILRRAAGVHRLLVGALKKPDPEGFQGPQDPQDPQGSDESNVTHDQNGSENQTLFISVGDVPGSVVVNDSQEILGAVGELAHHRCSRLLGIRAQAHAKMPLNEFAKLFEAALTFIISAERLCGKQSYALRGALLSQAKGFLETFHASKVNQLTILLENESWTQADIPLDFQDIVQRIAGKQQGRVHVTVDKGSSDLNLDEEINGRDESQDYATAASKAIVVNNQQYKVTSSVLMLLKMLADYLDIAARLPTLVMDVVSRVVEILKLYNTKSCQLVLGAGAMHVAGLKSISAKHLALTSQCLGLVIVLIPILRGPLAARLPSKHHVLLNDLEKVQKDVLEHRNEIYSKIVTIMTERLEYHCRALPGVNWDEESLPRPTPYMHGIVKETAILFKVLRQLLPYDATNVILSRIIQIYNQRLIEHFSKLEITTSRGRERLYGDIAHLLSNVRRMEGIDDPGNELDDFFKKRFMYHSVQS